MNKLIVLPGNSKRNQAWGEAVVAQFGQRFDSVYMQVYDHWEKDSNDMDVEAELQKLREAVLSTDSEYIVFAKSIGSLLALLAVQRGYFKPAKCVFFGMPLELAKKDLFKGDWSSLKSFSVPAIAFHNDRDPISYDATKTLLDTCGPEHLRLITKEGDNHDYLAFEEYEKEIDQYLNS